MNGSIFQVDEVINIYIKYVPIDVKSIASKNKSAGSNLWLCIRMDCSMKHNFLSCKKFDHSIQMRVTIYIAKQLKSFQVFNALFSSKTCLDLLSVIENVDAGYILRFLFRLKTTDNKTKFGNSKYPMHL